VNFPYGQYEVAPSTADPDLTVVFRPVIPVRVIGPAGAAAFYGLLDTGADQTVLPKALADLIGVTGNPARAATLLSASGEMSVTYTNVAFELGRGRGKVYWSATVAIIEEAWQEVVLGHAGFLEYFDATFFGVRRQVRLRRNTRPLPKS